ncbi:MAG: M28 family peptidase [Myxococcaceae bacterium]
MSDAWEQIEAEAREAVRSAGRFPLRAYSEFMPPPYVGIKPYAPSRASAPTTFAVSGGDTLDIDEYEQAHDLEPGLDRIAGHLLTELGRLVAGQSRALSQTLLEGNAAWPAELADAARGGKLSHDPLILICPLALSRTQDDKGNDRWTLFGASHDRPSASFFHGLNEARLGELLGWAKLDDAWRILAEPSDVPANLQPRLLVGASLAGVRTLVTFEPFAKLPRAVRAAYLASQLTLVPSPASLVFFEHPRYRLLARELPRATQIPLLHLFPRVEGSCAIRIPQSGWLDESDPVTGRRPHGHHVVSHVTRTHRWQRVQRDAGIHGDGMYTDKVSVALFSTEPEAVGLYDKPIARNSQIWTEDYTLLLDGPRADRAAIAHAAGVIDAGGRFGYRLYYPPMRAGGRELFWHLPLVARAGAGRFAAGPLGYATAEGDSAPPLQLVPRLLARPAHVAAARLFERDRERARHSTSHNVRKLLEARELLREPLPRSLGRALVHIAKEVSVDDWIASLPKRVSDGEVAEPLAATLRASLAPDEEPGEAIVLESLGTRAFEEQIWTSIAGLAHGEFRQKNGADGISVNRGKSGGEAAIRAQVKCYERRDLEALGDHLHGRYRELITKHELVGRAEVVDHVFRWETDFDFPWMEGWAKNQASPHERNVVLVIPGANRNEAVVMADHYDTAYMEDVFYPESGGDALRAPACGADDNHSATTALLLAAEHLLPLARAGRLARDVWLIHLTGEEFPADCMGARALGQALVEHSLAFTAENGSSRDASGVRVVGAFVLDMIGHNADRDRDVFQIASGEGSDSARLARRAHRANLRWNRLARALNGAPDRVHAGRAQRVPDAPPYPPPPPFSHLPLRGEVRVEWEPRSALFNTDGQIFSDLGIPVVLFMENYDISRKGYHDTHDTMENIDLDYCAALTAIAIETVADTACAREP